MKQVHFWSRALASILNSPGAVVCVFCRSSLRNYRLWMCSSSVTDQPVVLSEFAFFILHPAPSDLTADAYGNCACF